MSHAATLLVLVGSLRKESLNLKFARGLSPFAPPGYVFRIHPIGDLPPFNQDEERNPAPSVTALKTAVREAAGVIFVTPEYNRSVSGVLKNAIDQASRPYGDSAWRGKPAAVCGVTEGWPGTSMAQQHLRNILAHLDMPTLGQPEMFLRAHEKFFEPDGSLGPEPRKRVEEWMKAFAAWVERFARNSKGEIHA